MEEKKDAVVDETAGETVDETATDAAADEAIASEGELSESEVDAVEEEIEPEVDLAAASQDDGEPEDVDEPEGAGEIEPPVSESDAEPDQKSSVADAAPKKSSAKGIGDLVIVGVLSIILGVLLALPSFLGLTGSEEKSASSGSGLAATVNGTAISESDITEYISDFRTKQGLDSDDAWGEWMASYGYTAKDLRSDTIDYFVNRELLKQAIAEEGISVDESEVDKYISSITEQVGGESAFKEALEMEGLDLDTYREEIRFSLQQQALAEKVAGADTAVDDAEVLEVVKMYFPDSVDKNAKTLDGVDADTVEQVRSMLASSAIQEAFSTWMDDYRSKAKIVIVEMPESLSYAIDVTPYQKKLEQEQANNSDSSDAVVVDLDDESNEADEDLDVELVDEESTDGEGSSSASSKSAEAENDES